MEWRHFEYFEHYSFIISQLQIFIVVIVKTQKLNYACSHLHLIKISVHTVHECTVCIKMFFINCNYL